MAKKRKGKPQDTSSVDTSLFNKGMVKDMNSSFQGKATWSHARNAYNNSVDGDVGVIGNEPSNFSCADIPYPVIGAIHLYGDKWVLFLTDDTNSEIGLFDDSECVYEKIVNDICLNFDRKNLVKGASKENFDCTWQVYWDDDARNPSRTLNIDDVPWIQEVSSLPGADCVTYADTDVLDCEKIRLAPLVDTPCVKLSKADDGGQIRNGSYQVYIAYTVNEQKVGDYVGISNVQSLFDHNDTIGSLIIETSNLDKGFDYYELVLLSNTQGQHQAKKIGLYSTEQSRVSIDYIDQSLPVVPLEFLPLRNPAYEKSDSMYVVNDWLIRSGPTEQFDFNYQPIANDIKVKWVSAQYPGDYYYKGGNKPTFMRDEVYSLFIRWIYNTGERSSSYHIPGRESELDEKDPTGHGLGNPDEYNWQFEDTAKSNTEEIWDFPWVTLDDGGVQIGEGRMGYWESTEKYPQDPERWGDLCGKPIMHHKMPVESTDPAGSTKLSNSSVTNPTINILGIRLYDIRPPIDNDGKVIENIVGYEILRGSREGNKSILAKGIFRNMRRYNLDPEAGSPQTVQGYYPNFPYNDLGEDMYHSLIPTSGCISPGPSLPGPDIAKSTHFTFHSPELMFGKPFLNAYYAKLYGTVSGQSIGHFIKSEEHPKNKLLRNGSLVIAGIFGVGYALDKIRGTTDTHYKNAKLHSIGLGMNPTYPTGVTYGGSTVPVAAITTGGPPANLRAPVGQASAPGLIQLGTKAAVQTALEIAWGIVTDGIADLFLDAGDIVTGGEIYDNKLQIEIDKANAKTQTLTTGYIGGAVDKVVHGSAWKEAPSVFKLINGFFSFVYFASEGAQKVIDLIYELISDQDFAYKYNSHGFYKDYTKGGSSVFNYNSKIEEQAFINNTITSFGGGKVNNLQRPMTVGIQVKDAITNPSITDTSLYTIGDVNDHDNPGKFRAKTISAQYGALKFSFDNQYGQIEGIKQIPVRSCVHIIDKDAYVRYDEETLIKSPVMFGGDCYVNRYTEKTVMPFFWDFLKGQPDNYPYDYLKRQNIPHPRYWMNTERFSMSNFISSVGTSISSVSWQPFLPNDQYHMDRPAGDCDTGGFGSFDKSNNNSVFQLKKAYMYTHCNGVQDFYVESEINLAQRDWEEADRKRHYDWIEYTEYDEMFHAESIKRGNFYKYDNSLSVGRFPSTLTSWGNIQPRDYSPEVAETCFSYYPKRLIYSLQAQKEAKKDFWRVFLPNNYKDFKSEVNVIKPINKSGALIMFPYLSPQMFQGLDTLKTDLGTKLTIGDGGLFSQPFQNVVNSDISNEYGSCESERSVINTPAGLFYLSQAQGKVFQYAGQGLENIANRGMKWWFNKYLPSQLLKEFPELEGGLLSDNPVVGIGCQSIYDPNDDIVYFCKRDYVCNKDSVFPDIPEPVPGGDPPARRALSHKKVCNFIEYNQELGFVLNLTQSQGTPVTISCPDGYTYNEISRKCEKEICFPATVVDEEFVCPQGYTLTFIDDVWMCCRTESAAPITTDTYLPIDLNDGFYFKDISWTVSYDPKAKAWISFHDWHPELCLPSINHFLTTKTGVREEPECPNGYVYNPVTEKCERLLEGSEPAVVEVTNIPVTYIPGTGTECDEGVVEFTKQSNPTVIIQKWTRFCFNAPILHYINAEYAGDSSSQYGNGNAEKYTGLRPDGTMPLTGTDINGEPYFFSQDSSNVTDGTLSNPQYVTTSPVNHNKCEGESLNELGGLVDRTSTYNPSGGILEIKTRLNKWYYSNSIDKHLVLEPITGKKNTDSLRWVTFDPAANTNGCASNSDYASQYTSNAAIRNNTGEPTSSWTLTTNANWLVPLLNINQYTTLNDGLNTVVRANGPDSDITHQKMIQCISNSARYNGFYSVCTFQDYTHEVTIGSDADGTDGSNADNDTIGIVIAAFKDSIPDPNDSTMGQYGPIGRTYTLSVIFGMDPTAGTYDGDFPSGRLSGTAVRIMYNIGQEAYAFNNASQTPDGTSTIATTEVMRSEVGFYDPARDDKMGDGVAYSGGKQGRAYNPFTNAESWSGGDTYNEGGYVRVKIKKTGSRIQIWSTTSMGIKANAELDAGEMAPYTYPSNNPGDPGYSNGWIKDSAGAFSESCIFDFDLEASNLININTGSPSDARDKWGIDPSAGHHQLNANNISNPKDSSNVGVDFTGEELEKFVDKSKIGYLTLSNGGTQFFDIVFSGEQNSDGVCDCPEGFTKVWKDPSTGLFTLASGPECTDEETICRRLECECPTFPGVPPSEIDESGVCPTIYEVGDPTFVNTKICSYSYIDALEPGYEYGGIWKHNQRCDSFVNYYGVDYPFEVELVETTGQAVNTVRNLEYQMEAYVYKGNDLNQFECGDDRWHDLDFNFDEAIIYNTEQVSGLLKLNILPKGDPITTLQYPIINNADIEILYTKEEQKYRLNQFWDITKDRGEFTNVEQQIWITELNGYIKDLNSANLNYGKFPTQRKKFRHYYNKAILRRVVSGNRKMLLKLVNTKLNLSFR